MTDAEISYAEALEALKMQIVELLESMDAPMRVSEIARMTISGEGVVIICLADLCTSGPVVPIRMHGSCCYAIRWTEG